MRRLGFDNVLRANSISDLKVGEYWCCNCKRIIQNIKEVISDVDGMPVRGEYGNHYCSIKCREQSRNNYDQFLNVLG